MDDRRSRGRKAEVVDQEETHSLTSSRVAVVVVVISFILIRVVDSIDYLSCLYIPTTKSALRG